MSLTGTLTALGIHTFGAGDRPRLYDDGSGDTLTDILEEIDARLGLVPVGEVVLGADAATISFVDIAAGDGHLLLVVKARDTNNTAPTIRLRFNDDAGLNYAQHATEWVGGAAPSTAENDGVDQIETFRAVFNSHAADRYAGGLIHILNYADTADFKNVLFRGGFLLNAAVTSGRKHEGTGLWRSLSAITKVTLTPGGGLFAAGSRASLSRVVAP